MNTVILFWNPEISSYKMEDFQYELERMSYAHMNWSIYEHEKTHFGDRFFMVCCGKKHAGICMSGYIISEPYIGADWSGKDRVVYYADIRPDYMINPTCLPILSSEEIKREIPDFDWLGGHSGRLLNPESAVKLEALWKTFIEQHISMFGLRADKQEVDLDDYRGEDKELIELTIEEEGEVSGEVRCEDVFYCGDTVAETIDEIVKMLEKKLGRKVEYELDFDYVEEEDIPCYSKAVDMAIAKFKDEKDCFGKPYIAHLVRVAKDFCDTNKRIVALLQDVIKKGYAAPGDLFRMGFKQGIVDAILSLTQKDGESFKDFIKRVDANQIARSVMMSNLEDELNFYRYEQLTTDDLTVINEKLKAWRFLDGKNDNKISRDAE